MKPILDLKKMRPMERHNYISTNYKVCPSCSEKKLFRAFWSKEKNFINDRCNKCLNKEYLEEVKKLVINVIAKSGF